MNVCTAGDVPCGPSCRPSTRCCVSAAGWICGDTRHVCSTITGTIQCVIPSSLPLSVAMTCNNYGSGCASDKDCFECSTKAQPFCYPLIFISGTVTLHKTSCAITSDAFTIYGDMGAAGRSSSPTNTNSIGPSSTGPGPAPETSPPASQQTGPPAAAGGMSKGEIVGIVIGLCALLVLGAIFVVLRRRKAPVSAVQEYEAEHLGPYVPELAEPVIETQPVRKTPGRAELM